MPELPTGTVTFLFTDIEGSTKLLAEAGEAYGTLLEEHRRLITEAVEARGGVPFGTEGDAVFVAFDRAAAAVEAARIDVHQQLLAVPRPNGSTDAPLSRNW